MRIVIVGLALLLGLMGRLNAAAYFIDYAGGSDSSVGTSPEFPWQHCPGDSAAEGNAALISLFPGDTVLFKGGVTYVLTGESGIALNWSGAPSAPITYDGNSAGKWGSGRAIFSNKYGAGGITAFHAGGLAQNLAFNSFEFAGIGGEASLPADTSGAVPAKFGGGLAFAGGAESVTIENCAFRELGYWFNQKPMNAASIRGTAISSSGANNLTISNCEFSRMAVGCDFSSGGAFNGVTIKKCAFRDALVWAVSLPAAAAGDSVTISDSTFQEDRFFAGASWQGYGYDPLTEVADVAAGTTLSFAASAVSSPAASFQWRRNGVPIPGATGAVLTMSQVTLSDSGTYTAVASNAGGSTVSNPAVLLIDGVVSDAVAPVITQQPGDLNVEMYSTVAFKVSATGSPAPTYQWLKDGMPIAGETNSVLTLSSVVASAGYSVVVSNPAGSVQSRTAGLQVYSKTPISTDTAPVFTNQPADAFATLSSPVTFSATVSASPAPYYQWMKNGTTVVGATNSSFTIPQVSPNDAGQYFLIAKNTAGYAVSNTVTLTVGSAPVFTTQPISQAVMAGSGVTFAAAASASPAPYFQWFKNGSALVGATSATLRFDSVTKNDEGSYSLVAKNVAGSATSSSATLTVQDAYVPPPTTETPTVEAPAPAPTGPVIQRASYMLTVELGGKRNVGFLLRSDVPKTILIRAVGPTLAKLGIASPLADPQIDLFSGTSLVNRNDNWGGALDVAKASSLAGATPFISADSKDSALLMSLAPGAYNVIVSDVNGLGGTVLIEVYELP